MYRVYNFSDLSPALLYDILALRAQVFIEEQKSAYLDVDHLDQEALHVCWLAHGKLQGYARVLPPGIRFPDPSIGRLVIEKDHRRKGSARKMFQHSLEEIYKRFGNQPIIIEAQEDLRYFYASFGFAVDSEPYDWGGIKYIKMLKNITIT